MKRISAAAVTIGMSLALATGAFADQVAQAAEPVVAPAAAARA